MSKIGIYGGSFSPITIGHVKVARYVLSIVDKIIFVPCYHHPWDKRLASFKHRIKMCKLVQEKDMEVIDIERNLPGDTFSLIKAVKLQFRGVELFFIIGSDEANEFRKWKNYRQVHRMVNFIVVSRPGIPLNKQAVTTFQSPHIILPENDKLIKISSSTVRTNLDLWSEFSRAIGVDTRSMSAPYRVLNEYLDPKVLLYIVEHSLYKTKGVHFGLESSKKSDS